MSSGTSNWPPPPPTTPPAGPRGCTCPSSGAGVQREHEAQVTHHLPPHHISLRTLRLTPIFSPPANPPPQVATLEDLHRCRGARLRGQEDQCDY